VEEMKRMNAAMSQLMQENLLLKVTWICGTESVSYPNPQSCIYVVLARYLLTCILGVELPVAPLGPLRKCLLHSVLHIFILTPYSHPSLCGRNRVHSVFFETELEVRYWVVLVTVRS
jgi:hypothetical protein